MYGSSTMVFFTVNSVITTKLNYHFVYVKVSWAKVSCIFALLNLFVIEEDILI